MLALLAAAKACDLVTLLVVDDGVSIDESRKFAVSLILGHWLLLRRSKTAERRNRQKE